MAAPEPTAAFEVSEPLGYGGGSPATGPDDFKDEEPKENAAEAPTAEGREKVAVGAAGREGGTEAGAAAAEASGFCGTGEVGVVGILPAMKKWGKEGTSQHHTAEGHITEGQRKGFVAEGSQK